MKFKHNNKECDIEVFSNDEGIVVKFYDRKIEPSENSITDYVYVYAGYGYISLKRKAANGILSGFLKKDFFHDSMIVESAIDFVIDLLPNMKQKVNILN